MEGMIYYTVKLLGNELHVETIIATWALMIFLIILILTVRKTFKVIPGKIQTVLETVIGFFNEQAEAIIGPEGRSYTPIVFFIFITVLFFNWMGLLPSEFHINHVYILAPPTRDVNTTLALAMFTVIAFNYYGFKKKGIDYFKHFIEPVPEILKTMPIYLKWLAIPLTALFLVLNIVELLARVLSLTIRLFGNIMGEHIIAASLILFTIVVLKLFVVAGLVTYLLPLFVFFLSIVTGAVQAFIFAMLTLTYISGAIAEHE